MNEAGPMLFVDDDGRSYRVLGGRRYRPVASCVWVIPRGFYGATQRDAA